MSDAVLWNRCRLALRAGRGGDLLVDTAAQQVEEVPKALLDGLRLVGIGNF